MGASRALGVLLCIACVAVAVAHIYYGYWIGPLPHLAFALPLTIGLLVVCALGFWLGWIMASTKEAAPVAPAEPAPSVARGKTKRKKK